LHVLEVRDYCCKTQYSYLEAQQASQRIAKAMWAGGLRGEERVAILSPNDARVLLCMLGLMRAGGSACIGGGRELRCCSKIRFDYSQVQRLKLSRSARPSSPRNSRMTWRKRVTAEFATEGHRFIQIPKMSGNHNMKTYFIF
jgi:hypothetical protein